MDPDLIYTLILTTALYILKTTLAYFKLHQFRGPQWTGISNWPHSLAMLRYNCHECYADANRKYGPIARIAPRILITSSPEVWIHVNTKPGYKRSDWYYNAVRIEYARDNVFSQTDNARHEERRRQMGPGYSCRENPHLESTIDVQVQSFLNLIRTKYSSSLSGDVKPMDLARKVQFFTLDVISAVGLGREFGMLASDTDVDNYLQSSEEGLAIGNTALALGLSKLTQAPVLGRFIAPSPRDDNGFGKMMATAFRLVDERAKAFEDGDGEVEGSDMLASFMRHGLEGDELRTEALEQIIAGGILLHVITNPRVYRMLQSEIDEFAQGLDQGQKIVTAAQAKQLPYLQAVIREGLRLWPPVANIFSRDVPEQGDTVVVDGKSVFLPGGVCIGYSAHAVHQDEGIYGKDAKLFRPERWLHESDPERLKAMVKTNELVFGHGRFQCLGRVVAQMEIGKVVFELLRGFDLALVSPTKRPWNARN